METTYAEFGKILVKNDKKEIEGQKSDKWLDLIASHPFIQLLVNQIQIITIKRFILSLI